MNDNFVNRGIILGTRPEDYVAGTLPYEVRNPSGDWTPYLVKGEIQYSPKDDWKDCVSRSYTNCVEIQQKFLAGEEVDYSDRFLAQRSGTNRIGNYLYKVADFGRNEGLVLESSYPDTEGTWEEQYADISEPKLSQLLAEGKKWLERWDVKNEDIPFDKKSLQYHLKQAPVQVVIPGHAVVDILSNADIEKVFDSYIPYVKNIPGGYSGPLTFAKKIVLYKKEQALAPDTLLVNLKYGDSGKQVLRLKRALTQLGWLTEPGDIYDENLVKVVWNYQLANLNRFGWAWLWAWWYRGKQVEFYTRENINNNLKNRYGR